MSAAISSAADGRRRLRRGVALFLGLLLAALGGVIGAEPATADDAPIVSESFESGALPSGWVLAQFRAGVSTATVVDGPASDGSHLLRIQSPSLNHARVEIPVSLAGGTTYQVSVMARSSGTNAGGAAAVIGVDGTTAVSTSAVGDTWQRLDLYVRSDNAADVKLTLGLGNFGQENQGIADFDVFLVTSVASAPAGAAFVELNAPKPSPLPRADQVAIGVGPNKAFWIALGVMVVGVLTAAGLLIVRPVAPKSTPPTEGPLAGGSPAGGSPTEGLPSETTPPAPVVAAR